MTPRDADASPAPPRPHGIWSASLGFVLGNQLLVAIAVGLLVLAGLAASPFEPPVGGLPRSPVTVDAIPDIGENQQVVFTRWPGRSPRDVEDQVSYPLTTSLLGIPGVKSVRSFSAFGFSSIYVVFDDEVEFYWSRSRILEKLSSIPEGTLPPGAAPSLGPDATALGQVFWYTLEGRDEGGRVVGGWDPQELRTAQDFTVRYALQSVPGVSEVASVGGFVQQYQVNVDSEALLAYHVSIQDVADAVRAANVDVGARTLEINQVEYVIRGVGFVKSIEDLAEVVVRNVGHTPVRVRDVAQVVQGPASRRGALDKNGAPAVGGVVVARYGANPMEVIQRVQQKIHAIAPSLPRRTLADGRVSRITVVPFYDRSGLIRETLGTLSTALYQEVLITLIVVLVLLRRLRSSVLIAGLLPLGVLAAFAAMRAFGVGANVMALGGIAIAIGTMVDLSIVVTENVVEALHGAGADAPPGAVIRDAVAEVAPAVVTSTLTTALGFLPIFGLTAGEGKLFTPLALTKTFAMVGALGLALVVLPVVALWLLPTRRLPAALTPAGTLPPGLQSAFTWLRRHGRLVLIAGATLTVVVLLADDWLPLGAGRGFWLNRAFVLIVVGALLGLAQLFVVAYPRLLGWALAHKGTALALPVAIVAVGVLAWLGAGTVFGANPTDGDSPRSGPIAALDRVFPGFGREYMPPLDEGSFLVMPTTMPHASVGQALRQLSIMDAAIEAIPEVDVAVGKLGRAETPLDPAPISMFETVVNYKPEYRLDASGRRQLFRYDDGAFVRDGAGQLVPDPWGRPFRQWRDHIRSPDDIWNEIQAAVAIPGVTSAPKLMPIAARIVMLQSGMRAPMGLKIRGPDLASLEAAGLALERQLKQAPGVRPETVIADRIVGKPYLEIVIDRREIARHGISVQAVQNVIQTGIGGDAVTKTVEGRERYPVVVRYMREERDSLPALKRALVPSPLGHQIPLSQVATFRYVRGPQVIKSEDTFLTAYLVFDKQASADEVGVVEAARRHLEQQREAGALALPAGVTYEFSGSYENQVRSERTLRVLVPLAVVLIFLLIYLQFRSARIALFVFSGVAVACGGAFLTLWAYHQPWFLAGSPLGVDLRTLLQVAPVNMSVAVWVGFIALVGIATDDGVVMATYLKQRFDVFQGTTTEAVRGEVQLAAKRRVRACMMTTATTVLALLPVVTSTGRGSDIMVPMTLPLLGGMAFEVVTLFVVPVLYCWDRERRLTGG